MINEKDIIPIGKFQKTHALKGELNMLSDIDTEYFMEGNPMIIENDGILVPYYAENIRPKGSLSYLVKISGIDSEEEASEFVNKEIYILKKDAEDWLGDSIDDYISLIGFDIIDNNSGEIVGKIVDSMDIKNNFLWIVKKLSGEEFYIPDNDDFIIDLDEENHTVRMNLPEGLSDINNIDD